MKITKKYLTELQNLVDFFGSQANLMRKLKVSRTCISLWIKGKETIPLNRAIEIEILTKGKFKAKDIRPDLKHLKYF